MLQNIPPAVYYQTGEVSADNVCTYLLKCFESYSDKHYFVINFYAGAVNMSPETFSWKQKSSNLSSHRSVRESQSVRLPKAVSEFNFTSRALGFVPSSDQPCCVLSTSLLTELAVAIWRRSPHPNVNKHVNVYLNAQGNVFIADRLEKRQIFPNFLSVKLFFIRPSLILQLSNLECRRLTMATKGFYICV